MSELERVLAPLRDGPVPLATSAERELDRERLLPLVRSQVRELPARLQRARRRRLLTRLTALAAAVAGVAGLVLRFGPSAGDDGVPALRIEPLGVAPVAWRDDGASSRTYGAPVRLPARGVLSSGEVSAARVTTPSGVRIELAERTQVDLGALDGQSRNNSLRLLSGAVECRVPPLGPGERFSVITRSAEVIVHGTVFSVRTAGDDASTCIRVSEGRVTVRHASGSVELGPGESHGCSEAKAPASSAAFVGEVAPGVSVTPEAARPAEPRPSERVRAPRERRPEPKETRAGTLEQENLLLSRALSAERGERCSLASSLFSELLRRYPGSPLAPEARAGLERCNGLR